MIVFTRITIIALVAQWQSPRLLSGGMQVRVLPGALSVRERARNVMERLISLFREPDDGYPPLGKPREPLQASLKVISDEPIYFQQLLEYLRQEKQKEQGTSGSD